MRISYDTEFDIPFQKFAEGPHQVANQNPTDDIALDLDEKGKIVGMEFLSASKYFDLSTLLPVTGERA